ncbi:MAG TPA: hypothetical protein VG826_26170 [Pirellulales bacterium]|nr:hypothetical protein [Pirellulales bacterium]
MRHRVPWIQEADQPAAMAAVKGSVVVEAIKVNGLALRMLSSSRHLEIVVLGDVWNTNNQDAHATASTMNNSGWDMNQRTSGNGMVCTIEVRCAAAIERS